MQAAPPRSRATATFSWVIWWLFVSLVIGILLAFFGSSFINEHDLGKLLASFGFLPCILALTSSHPREYMKHPAWGIALPLLLFYIIIVASFFWYLPLALNLSGAFLTLLIVAIIAQRIKFSSIPGWLLAVGCRLIGGVGAALIFWSILGPGIVNLPMLFVLVLLTGLVGLVGRAVRDASETLRLRLRRRRTLNTSEQATVAVHTPLSRREALLGLGGLVGLAVTGGGFTWLSRSLLAHAFPLVTYKSFGKVQRLSWSPDGTQMVAVVGESFVGGGITIWETATGKEYVSFLDAAVQDYFAVRSVAWSPDGTNIALGGDYGLLLSNTKVNAALIDAVTLRPILTFSAGKSETNPEVFAVAWSPDSTRVAISSGEIQIWDAATGEQMLTFKAGLFILAWSPNGRFLVTDANGIGNECEVPQR